MASGLYKYRYPMAIACLLGTVWMAGYIHDGIQSEKTRKSDQTVGKAGFESVGSAYAQSMIRPEEEHNQIRSQLQSNEQSINSKQIELALVKIFELIRKNQLGEALHATESLLELSPNYRLAQLIKADLLLAQSQPIQAMGGEYAHSEKVDDLRAEAYSRLKRYTQTIPIGKVPRYLVHLQPEQRYLLIADSSESRLYLFENKNGKAQYHSDYYMTVGKNGVDKLREGDQRTPIGVYFVVANLPKSKLSDFYGDGAFPLNYPNEWDKQHGRTGHGIWLHGTPSDTYSRPPRASNGCVVVTNDDLKNIRQMLQIGTTPVIISDKIEWADASSDHPLEKEILKEVENWRKDWESRDVTKYLSYYSSKYRQNGQDFYNFAKQKVAVNATKTYVNVNLSQLSVFEYPNNKDLIVVTFWQDYRSNNLNQQMRKRQYWTKENGQWKILFESAA